MTKIELVEKVANQIDLTKKDAQSVVGIIFQSITDSLSKGDKVKFTIKFKGRELRHSHLGDELMEKIKQDMQEIGRVELQPKFDGKQIVMVIQPL